MSKNKSKHKLPKHFAGIKVPKQIRKAGGEMLAWAATSQGRGAIAALLSAGAAALAETKPGQDMARRVGGDIASGGEKISHNLQQLLSALAVGASALLAPATQATTTPAPGGTGDAPSRPH